MKIANEDCGCVQSRKDSVVRKVVVWFVVLTFMVIAATIVISLSVSLTQTKTVSDIDKENAAIIELKNALRYEENDEAARYYLNKLPAERSQTANQYLQEKLDDLAKTVKTNIDKANSKDPKYLGVEVKTKYEKQNDNERQKRDIDDPINILCDLRYFYKNIDVDANITEKVLEIETSLKEQYNLTAISNGTVSTEFGEEFTIVAKHCILLQSNHAGLLQESKVCDECTTILRETSYNTKCKTKVSTKLSCQRGNCSNAESLNSVIEKQTTGEPVEMTTTTTDCNIEDSSEETGNNSSEETQTSDESCETGGATQSTATSEEQSTESTETTVCSSEETQPTESQETTSEETTSEECDTTSTEQTTTSSTSSISSSTSDCDTESEFSTSISSSTPISSTNECEPDDEDDDENLEEQNSSEECDHSDDSQETTTNVETELSTTTVSDSEETTTSEDTVDDTECEEETTETVPVKQNA